MIPLRLVIDTNVLVSAALKPDGLQRTILLLATTKPARLYVSEAILAEYRKVLARPELKNRRGLRQQLLQLIRSHSHPVKPSRALQVTKDPDDNKFLECADAARADYLVTGNQRHFPRFWKKTKVITSRDMRVPAKLPAFTRMRSYSRLACSTGETEPTRLPWSCCGSGSRGGT